jgi:hypothetical protein
MHDTALDLEVDGDVARIEEEFAPKRAGVVTFVGSEAGGHGLSAQ